MKDEIGKFPLSSFPFSSFFATYKSVVFICTILGLVFSSIAHTPDQIRIGYGSLSTSYSPIWTAGEARLFQKNGIDAEVLYLESALVRTALIAGDITLGGMSGPTMAAPRLQRTDLMLIAIFLNPLQ